MNLLRTNRLWLDPNFAGPFASEELAALFDELLAARAVEPLVERHEGRVLHCSGLETFTDDEGPGVRVDRVTWVQDGQLLEGKDLTVRVRPGETRVFLHTRPAPAALTSLVLRQARFPPWGEQTF